jgi:hypothetical protein
MMERMRAHQIQLSYFLEHALVERVCRSVGKDPRPLLAAQQNANAHPEDDFVEEEV